MAKTPAANKAPGNVPETVQSNPIVVPAVPRGRFRLHHHAPLVVHVIVGRGLEDEVRRWRRGFQYDGLLDEPRSRLPRVLKEKKEEFPRITLATLSLPYDSALLFLADVEVVFVYLALGRVHFLIRDREDGV